MATASAACQPAGTCSLPAVSPVLPATSGAAPPVVTGSAVPVAAQPAVAGTTDHVPTVEGKVKWKPVEVITTLALAGGFQTKQQTVESRSFEFNGAQKYFVHVTKRSEWLIKMGGGTLKRAGDILDTLKTLASTHRKSTVVDEATGTDAKDEADPMDQLDDVFATPEPKRAKKTRSPIGPKESPRSSAASRKGVGVRDTVLEVEVSKRSHSAWPFSKEKVKVAVVMTNPQGKGRLWIEASALPWLVAYVADEVGTGGVTLTPAVAGMTANCDTPYLSIRLEPDLGDMGTYKAVFVDGPLKNQTPMFSVIQNMTQTKWDACQATGARWQSPGGPFAYADPTDIARATSHFLELTCARMLLTSLLHDSLVADPIAEAVRVVEASKNEMV